MTEILVLYYSRNGSVEKLANHIARGIGEYGSVVFISGNLPYQTEITPLLIVIKLEQFDHDGAAALGFIMLVMSFVMLFALNLVQAWGRRRQVAARN